MSLYDEAMAAGESPVPPETLQKLLAAYQANPSLRTSNGEGDGGTTYSGVPGAVVDGYTISLDPNTGQPLISKFMDHESFGQDKAAVYNLDGTFGGYSSGDSEALSAAKFVALSAGAYYGAGALNGMQGAAAASTAGANAGLDSAYIGMANGLQGGTGLAEVAAGTGASSFGVAPAAADVSTALTAAETGAAPLAEGGLQTIEVVGSKLPSTAVLSAEELAMGGLAGGSAADLGSTPDGSSPFDQSGPDYSHEGTHYPTETSTQGPGGSPVNASQFPGTSITDVNGNPVTQPTYDSNGNQVVPPVSNNGGTNPITNTPSVKPGTNDFKNLFDILSGLYGLKLANDAAEKSDPFGPYRKGYADKLQALEANPGLLKGTPGFMAGQDSISRQMASKGYLGSGNQAASLQRFSGDFYNNEANRLATLAGANIAPGNTYFNEAQLASKSLSNIGYGLSPYMGGPR